MDENKTSPEQDGLDLEELDKELEDLREKFQKQLDEETARANSDEGDGANDEMLIQPLDEIDEAAPKEAQMCECCGEKPRDVSFGEDYPYCADCRALMKANPVNPLGIIMLAVMIAVFVGAIFMSGDHVNDYNTLITAGEAYSQKKLTDAVTHYQSYLSGKTAEDAVSKKAVRNSIEAFADLGYYADANRLIEEFMPDAKGKYAEIQEEYRLLSATSPLINEKFSDVFSGKAFDYDKTMKELDSLIKENEQNEKYSTPFLEYTKYIAMLQHGSSNEDLLKQLQHVESIDEGKHPWIYLPNILDTCAKLGDRETAEQYFKKSTALNVQEMAIYIAYADAFRFSDTPDADKMLEIAKQAESVCSQHAYPAYHRIYAAAYLLKEDGENALLSMRKYMESCQATLNDFNLFALCALYAGDKELYGDIEAQLSGYGYDISKTVKKFESGKISIIEAVTDKGGEI